MKDYATVIEDLKLNIRWIRDIPAHQFPGWGNVVIAMEDAIERIKADREMFKDKEARILTIDEAYNNDIVWYESRCVYDSEYGSVYPGDSKTSAVIRRINYLNAFEDDRMYGIVWRCWSKKPTDEQRKVAKWNEE